MSRTKIAQAKTLTSAGILRKPEANWRSGPSYQCGSKKFIHGQTLGAKRCYQNEKNLKLAKAFVANLGNPVRGCRAYLGPISKVLRGKVKMTEAETKKQILWCKIGAWTGLVCAIISTILLVVDLMMQQPMLVGWNLLSIAASVFWYIYSQKHYQKITGKNRIELF
jgi:hypothetical protein